MKTETYMWINDLLKSIEENPTEEMIKRLENCGKCCAVRKGAFEGIKQLKKLAEDCRTRSDYVKFLNNHTPEQVKFVEVNDGIELHLGNKECSRPMYPKVQSPVLCNCTKGHEKITWSEFFGKPTDVQIKESHLRGGKECVLKFFV